MSCADRSQYVDAVYPGTAMPRSQSVRSTADDDLRELVRAVSQRDYRHLNLDGKLTSTPATIETVPRSQSVAVGRIDEDKPLEFDGDVKLGPLYPRSRREPIVPKPRRLRSRIRCSSMAAAVAKEILPPSLDSTSEPPALFDGTTRLYIAYICPYAQRPWIVRNYKGLQEKIELVSIDLKNRPAWYKEKVYSGNKVPCLEHHNEVKGESLDLIKYIDANFDGPTLLPDDFEKKKFAEELISYSDSFNKVNFAAFTSEGDVETNLGSVYDKLEDSLSKFDGPFFLGEFSLVEIVYAPFIERFQIFHTEVKNYDITKGRAKLAQWIEELNTLEAYKQTRRDPQEHLAAFKQRFGIN